MPIRGLLADDNGVMRPVEQKCLEKYPLLNGG
jgi:hypothetical protein